MMCYITFDHSAMISVFCFLLMNVIRSINDEKFWQLLVKNPPDRLGMPTCVHGEIRRHGFFKTIKWDLLEQRKISPPFKPAVVR